MESKDLFRKIHRLEIKTKGLTRQLLSGNYNSAFKGSGMTFSEVREYATGDEVRTIDWNVTARYSSPYVKVFDEEREVNILLLVDVSASSQFGTTIKSKKELAIEMAAVIAFSASLNNDKIGLITFSDKIERYVPTRKGRKQAHIVVRELIEHEPSSSGTSIDEALKFLRMTQKKRSVVVLITDGIDEKGFMDSLRLTKKQHDVVVIHITDSGEFTLPSLGFLQLINPETKEVSWFNSSSTDQQSWLRDITSAHQNNLKLALKKYGVDYISCSTEEEVIKPLIHLFQRRS
jgi:uncharacterized protein (DUF58 family)